MNGSRRIGYRIWVELNPEGKKYSSSGRRSESCTAMEVGGSTHSVKVGGKGSQPFIWCDFRGTSRRHSASPIP